MAAWEAAPLAQTAPIGGGFTGYIPGSPKPEKPPEPDKPPSGFRWTNGPGSNLVPIPGGPADKSGTEDDPGKAALKDALTGLGIEELLTGVTKARGAVNSGVATGVTGAVLGMLPGTQAADLRSEGGYLDQIQGGIINEKLQALKEASKTGASGMGALSEREGARMAASVAALGKNMSDQALLDGLNDVERHAKTLQAVRDGLDPRDPEVQKKYGIPILDADIWGTTKKPSVTVEDAPATPRDNTPAQRVEGLYESGQSDTGLKDMSGEQKRAYRAFWKANPKPTAGQLSTFFGSIGLPGVREADAQNIIEGVNQGLGYSTAVDRTMELRAEIAGQNADPQSLGTTPEGALRWQGATLGASDEGAGIARGLSKALQFENPIEGYMLGRDAERLRIDDARRQLGYGGTAIEVISGLATANPQGALAPFTSRAALVGQGAKSGLAAGALGGFNYGEGTEGSLAGAALGGAGGAALGAGVSALSARYAPRGLDPELAAAAQAEDVRLIQPMVDPATRGKFGALESNPASQNIIRRGVADVRNDIERGVERLGGSGTALEGEAVGDVTQGAGQRFITRSRGVATNLYNRAKTLGGNTAFNGAQKGMAAADAEIADASQAANMNSEEIAFLEGLKADLANAKTVDNVRAIRTSLRGKIGQANLTATQAEARALRVLDAAKQDLEAALPRDAFRAYQRADAFYAARQSHIDDVIHRFLGRRNAPLSAEQTFSRLKSMASPGGDGRRLAAMMRNLEPEERLDVAATVAQGLGRRAPDEPFSTDLFVSQVRKLSPSAQRTIFGPQGEQSIANLKLLSRKLGEAVGDTSRGTKAGNLLRNSARTFIAGLTGLGGYGVANTGGAIAGATAAAGIMAASAGRKVLSARALMSPRVSRWLAEAADVNTPAQAQQALRRLGTVITREPGLATELTPIQQFLQQSLSPARASEEGQGDDEQR